MGMPSSTNIKCNKYDLQSKDKCQLDTTDLDQNAVPTPELRQGKGDEEHRDLEARQQGATAKDEGDRIHSTSWFRK